MRNEQRIISPHEPDQPIAGLEEAIRDSEEMLKVWEEKKRRRAKALQELQDAGMVVLGAPAPRSRRARKR